MTHTKIALGALSLIFLAGCSLPGIGEEKSDPAPQVQTKIVTVTVTPEPTATPEASQEVANEATPTAAPTPETIATPEATVEASPESTPAPVISTDAEFDAKVQAAVLKYISENRTDFGKEVIESANAYQAIQQAQAEAKKSEAVKNVPAIRSDEHIKGNKDAQFVLYEYSDFKCPFCQRFHPTSKEFIKKNPDVALVFRAMPLDQLHPKSRGIHEVAECVAEQGGNDVFWKFADSVFAKEVTSNEDYQAAAKKAGITDIAKVEKCVQADTYKQKIADSSAEGASLGIQGTPTSILKNTKTGEVRLIGGAYPLEALDKALAELK